MFKGIFKDNLTQRRGDGETQRKTKKQTGWEDRFVAGLFVKRSFYPVYFLCVSAPLRFCVELFFYLWVIVRARGLGLGHEKSIFQYEIYNLKSVPR